MKSAYELAMERLNQESPSRQLSDAEKAELAEIEKKYAAKIAELKLAHDAKMSGVNPMEAMELQQELSMEVARLEGNRDAEKDALWDRASS